MIIAKLAGWSHPKLSAMPEEKREAFIANWPGLASIVAHRKKAYAEKQPDEVYNLASYEYGTRQRISFEEAHALEIAGIEIELEAVDGTMLTKMQHRADKYGSITPMEMTTGQVVQIAVPDLGILQINETDWLEDACTEVLQGRLDDGWRILAVCPPNAQRRPDYILGRHNPDRRK